MSFFPAMQSRGAGPKPNRRFGYASPPRTLAVFEDLLSDGSQNPYQVSTIHPPYGVRVTALMRAASRLDLTEHTTELQKLLGVWAASQWRAEKTNRYRSLAAVEVIDALIDGAFRFCEQLTQVRHDGGREAGKAFRISSGDRRVYTTFAIELEPPGEAETELLQK